MHLDPLVVVRTLRYRLLFCPHPLRCDLSGPKRPKSTLIKVNMTILTRHLPYLLLTPPMELGLPGATADGRPLTLFTLIIELDTRTLLYLVFCEPNDQKQNIRRTSNWETSRNPTQQNPPTPRPGTQHNQLCTSPTDNATPQTTQPRHNATTNSHPTPSPPLH